MQLGKSLAAPVLETRGLMAYLTPTLWILLLKEISTSPLASPPRASSGWWSLWDPCSGLVLEPSVRPGLKPHVPNNLKNSSRSSFYIGNAGTTGRLAAIIVNSR